MIFERILACESRVSSALSETRLDSVLFREMIIYVNQLLDSDVVRFETSPLMDVTLFFARLLYSHFTNLFDQEEADRARRWEMLRADLANALRRLLDDVGRWLAGQHRRFDCFARRSEVLMQQVSSMTGAHWLVTKMGPGLPSRRRRLELLCDDDTLDEYFDMSGYAYHEFASASERFRKEYKPAEVVQSKRGVDLLLLCFPQLKTMGTSLPSGIPILVDPSGSNLESLLGAIRCFTPFFAPISRPVSTATSLSVSKAAAPTEFNLLLGRRHEKLEFLLPSLTADLGTHIEQACCDKCGVVRIENLSAESVTVELTVNSRQVLLGHLESRIVPICGTIEVLFSLESQQPQRPFMAWFDGTLRAISGGKLEAVTQLRAYVRCSPLCAVIESSVGFRVSESSRYLAPDGYISSIAIRQTLPNALYVRNSVRFLASSTPENEIQAPSIQYSDVTKVFQWEFKTAVTGRCAATFVIGLGLCRLCNLGLSVYVKKDSGFVLYHPAARRSASVCLAPCNSTFIILANRTSTSRKANLVSSCATDRLEPESVNIGGFTSMVIKVTFGDSSTRSITCQEARLELRKIFRSPFFAGTKFVVEDGAFLWCCVVQPGQPRGPCYLKTRDFAQNPLTVIITETAVFTQPFYSRSAGQTEIARPDIVRIGLDPRLGLTEWAPSQAAPDGVFILWGEDRSSGTPVFIRQMQIREIDLSRALDELRATRGKLGKSDSIQGLIVKAANGLLGFENRIQRLTGSAWLAKTKNDQGPFARLPVSCMHSTVSMGGLVSRSSRSCWRSLNGPADVPG
jgi:hypothetical protein